MKTNHTRYAILGILTTGCRTGYQIKQLIDKSLNHFWKISYGQIYPTLKQLVEEGLATVQQTTQDGKPDTKEYFLTSKGEEELRKWLSSPLETIPVPRNEVLLKLFFSRHQHNDKTIEYLSHYQEVLNDRLYTYEEIEQTIRTHSLDNEDAQYWLFTLDYGKRVTTAEIEWCYDTINKLEGGS
ncbi:PadR family transcriptional regulator [Ornithinibacillus californiensis]|uniref:PadR family transcriptional regulator n=1 Tax=Ornithinibacillus californiensis TaxID=161536 RepID=UPI00064E105C|nr:PadR family transcriptional regulator [Ornithinibacillus californiensis]